MFSNLTGLDSTALITIVVGIIVVVAAVSVLVVLAIRGRGNR